MKQTRNMVLAIGVCLGISLRSVVGQSGGGLDAQGPDRILKLLNDKERAYLEDNSKSADLTPEEMEHAKRVKRLHELETEKDVITEPAGAELAANTIATPVAPAPGIEELEIQQQEDANMIMRDLARLRAQVVRLSARVHALESELEGTVDPSFQEEVEPSFYLPVR